MRGPEVPAAWAAAMDLALREAAQAPAHGDVPVGAVLLGPGDEVLSVGRNRREERGDPTAHAEVLALRDGPVRHGDGWRLGGCTLVVTLEPCAMCAGAMVAARLARCVFGAWDDKAGACGSVWDLPRDPAALHRVEVVGGVRAGDAASLLLDFFRAGRGGRA